MNCNHCRFYRPGECHLLPPVRLPRKFVSSSDRTRDEELMWGWPEVKHTDWCGKFEEHHHE